MNLFAKLTALEKEAADFGFMWSDAAQIFEQIQNECQEIKDNLSHGGERSHLQEEIGDLMHAVFSLCLFMGFRPQETCAKSVEKFEKRFQHLKRLAQAAGFETLQGQPIDVLMHFWEQAKKTENASTRNDPNHPDPDRV